MRRNDRLHTQSSASSVGARGERLAAAYLRGLGYRVLARNFRTCRAEVDIVAAHSNDLVFVEVKHWQRTPAAALEYAIGVGKRARIASAASWFVARRPELAQRRWRFDVVLLGASGPPVHLRGAFDQ